jgi:eukaryotic-like serine/threonine-protein kinase
MSAGFEESYRVVGELPAGDAAHADRAVASDGTEVALLTVRARDPEAFLRQVSAMSAVTSPYLPAFLGWERRGDDVVVATELVQGDELTGATSRGQPQPQAAVTGLGIEAASALAPLHGRGVVHGGVKPSTLVRTTNGHFKLIDAGVAHAQGGADLGAGAPARGAWYVSPEEAGGQPLTPASDVYSLGVVLYHLATGRPPFDGPDAATVAHGHLGAQPVSPRQIDPSIAPELEAVVLRCLAKTPTDRYPTGAELARALEDVEGSAATLVAPAIAGGAEATTVMPKPTPPPSAPAAEAPPPAKKKRRVWLWILVGLIVAALIGLAIAWAAGAFKGSVTVPDVTGMSLQKATTTLENAGLKLGTVNYQQGQGAQGTILSQSPGAGASVKDGSAVDVVAVGTSVKAVPNVVGMSQSAASAAIVNAGFAVGTVSAVNSSSVPKGQVTDQAPAAGTQAPTGSQIALTVSAGPKPSSSPQPVAVPDVTGQTQAQATSTLQSAGFAVVVVKEPSDTVPSGSVIDQTPSAGVVAAPGTSVTMVVSTGPSPTPTPSGT